MAPPLLLVLHEKKEDNLTRKYFVEVECKAPPGLDDVMDENKLFKT
jgi:hypothetical protein